MGKLSCRLKQGKIIKMVEIEGLLYSDDEKRLLSAYNSDESDIEIQNGVLRAGKWRIENWRVNL